MGIAFAKQAEAQGKETGKRGPTVLVYEASVRTDGGRRLHPGEFVPVTGRPDDCADPAVAEREHASGRPRQVDRLDCAVAPRACECIDPGEQALESYLCTSDIDREVVEEPDRLAIPFAE